CSFPTRLSSDLILVYIDLASMLFGGGDPVARAICLSGPGVEWQGGRDCRSDRQHQCELQALSHIRASLQILRPFLKALNRPSPPEFYPEPDGELNSQSRTII